MSSINAAATPEVASSIQQPHSESTPHTSRQYWGAVLSLALTAAMFCTTEFMPVGLLRFIADGLSISEGSAGLTVTAPGLFAALAAPVLTVLVRKQDRRLVLWGLGVLLVASNLIAALATSFPMLLVGRVLFGVGLGGFWAIGAGMGERLVRKEAAPKATAIIFAGVSLGMLVGGAAGALIGQLWNWRAGFGLTAALAAVALAIQLITLPPMSVSQHVTVADILGILKTPKGRAGLLAMMLALLGQFAAYTYITPFLAQQGHFDGKTISGIMFGYTLIGMVGNFIGGGYAGRNVKAALATTILLIGVPLLLLPIRGAHPLDVLVLLAIWGLAYGAMPVVLQVWMASAASQALEGGMALFVANFQISIALGALLGGTIVDRVGMAGAMFGAAGLSLVALVVTLAMGRRD